jgi:uncharacterized protein YkwD
MSAAVRPVAGLTLAAALLLCSLATAAPARAAACAGADATGGPPAARTHALRCLASQVRARAHRGSLRGATALGRSAAMKAETIERCGAFSHTPCGESWTGAMRRTGYARGCYTVGENLAWVTVGVTPRDVLEAWLASPEHRANLLSARFRDTGVATRVVTLPDAGTVELWVQHFGTRC